jgi:hypothetical protein
MKKAGAIIAAVAIISLVANVFFAVGYISANGGEDEDRSSSIGSAYLSDYRPYIEDAKRRWIAKLGREQDALYGRTVSVITFPDRVCVSFEYAAPIPPLKGTITGGLPPVYCYDPFTTNIVFQSDELG